MNKQEYDVLNDILENSYTDQRSIGSRTGYALGTVNGALKALSKASLLDEFMQPTPEARQLQASSKPEHAVILAAGFGMRMVPINTQTPKGLLEVHGQTLIERMIGQLHQAGVTKICVVVGFMKEQYEYLVDQYGVELVYNKDYAAKNNLHSLALAQAYLRNCYIVPCDIWCRENPFRSCEFYPWYLVTDRQSADSTVRVNRQQLLSKPGKGKRGNHMIGISYLPGETAVAVGKNLQKLSKDHRYDNAFWEEALLDREELPVYGRVWSAEDAIEINTYEQLRTLDRDSENLHSDAINTILEALDAQSHEITDITVLKKGMTNRSFLFRCKDKRYIMRIPGEGTDQLINRREEAAVYAAIDGKHICDDIAYMNPESGYKITEFLEDARVCDPESSEDIRRCMQRLRQFHEQKLQVDHTFDIFKQIDFYESLWQGSPSCFRDYTATKQKVLSLKPYIDSLEKSWTLTHIDAVPDNFLFTREGDIRLIDWEYAGMQDPHVDIAMFCIYAMYDRDGVENLIDAYFPEGCPEEVRTKIYCYIAACGLLWSNWCEYKRQLGVEFGEYSLRQYRYAKEYYKLAVKRINEGESYA